MLRLIESSAALLSQKKGEVKMYPINYGYDLHDGSFWEGFAKTAEEAMAQIQASRSNGWDIINAVLDTCEVGCICKTRADFERHWQAEIKTGWVQPMQIWGGWRGEATFWRTVEHEKE